MINTGIGTFIANRLSRSVQRASLTGASPCLQLTFPFRRLQQSTVTLSPSSRKHTLFFQNKAEQLHNTFLEPSTLNNILIFPFLSSTSLSHPYQFIMVRSRLTCAAVALFGLASSVSAQVYFEDFSLDTTVEPTFAGPMSVIASSFDTLDVFKEACASWSDCIAILYCK